MRTTTILLSLAAGLMLSGPAFAQATAPDLTYPPAALNADVLAKVRASADAGDVLAQLQMGDACYYGDAGVAEDHAAAAAWYRKAAEQGNADAQTNLGVMYAEGDGVDADDAQAVAWNRKAADQGVARAQYNLGIAYDQGIGVARDLAQAFAWYQKAADQGYEPAQYNLGNMYETGEGGTQDLVQARAWYAKAADHGYPPAAFALGNLLIAGTGGAKDEAGGFALIEKAAKAGFPPAEGAMAQIYAGGLAGQLADKVTAYAWALLASADGDYDASLLLNRMDAGRQLNDEERKRAIDLSATLMATPAG